MKLRKEGEEKRLCAGGRHSNEGIDSGCEWIWEGKWAMNWVTDARSKIRNKENNICFLHIALILISKSFKFFFNLVARFIMQSFLPIPIYLPTYLLTYPLQSIIHSRHALPIRFALPHHFDHSRFQSILAKTPHPNNACLRANCPIVK